MGKEIWKDIKGYEGIYQVSNLGNIKSLNYNNTMKPKLRKTSLNHFGYEQVILFKDGEGTCFRVHRLVAQAFIPNDNNLPEINHIDENKINNCSTNLEWCTRKYNMNYGKAAKNPRGKAVKPIIATNISTNEKIIFASILSSKRLGFDPSEITKCLKREDAKSIRKTHKGYKFELLSDDTSGIYLLK